MEFNFNNLQTLVTTNLQNYYNQISLEFNQMYDFTSKYFMDEVEPYVEQYSYEIMNVIQYNYNNLITFIENNQSLVFLLSFSLLFFMLNLILLIQYYNNQNINILVSEKTRMLVDTNRKQEEEINTLKKVINTYRKLRITRNGLGGGFFILKGKPSDRNFRALIRELNGRYLGNSEYLLKLKYFNKFERSKIIV